MIAGWWFQFFLFSTLPGEMIQFDQVETINSMIGVQNDHCKDCIASILEKMEHPVALSILTNMHDPWRQGI